MNRTIYNFYCYGCYAQNISNIPYPLITHNGKIDRIYCPHCNNWIHFKNTNLSPERFFIALKGNWIIIDEDSPARSPVYAVTSRDTAIKIRNMLNNHSVTIRQLSSDPSFFQTIEWYVRTFI